MKWIQRHTNILRLAIILQMLITILIPLDGYAYTPLVINPTFTSGEILGPEPVGPASRMPSEISAQTAISPTLEIDILGTPYAPYDFNSAIAPEVFVVHAQVVNTGTITAENVTLTLDFTDDGGSGWVLLDGEVDVRSIDELTPSSAYNAYWFAISPLQSGAAHTYTVTVTADDFIPIQEIGYVEVEGVLDTSNAFKMDSAAYVAPNGDISISVTYDLGTNPSSAGFSPVGNADFLPGNYRLISTQTEFLDESHTPLDTFFDQIHFPTLSSSYHVAKISYEFKAISPTFLKICPYELVDTVRNKYDKQYCTEPFAHFFQAITGTVFHDENQNGIMDTLEAGIEGVTITLDGLYTTTTNANGAYTFPAVTIGIHTIVETDLVGYISTTPNEVDLTMDPGGLSRVNFGDKYQENWIYLPIIILN